MQFQKKRIIQNSFFLGLCCLLFNFTLPLFAQDGSIDNTFNNGGTGADISCNTITLQSDGKILIGGNFTNYNGVNVPDRILRLNADGSVDNTFNNGGTGTNSTVLTIAVQSDDKVLMGGHFSQYNGVIVPTRIIRLNADGSFDNTFNNGGFGPNMPVISIVLQSDGLVLIGGSFSQYNGVNVPGRIIRLNVDGSVDNTFNNGGTGANSHVRSVVLQSDGQVLIGGSFSQYNGVNVPNRIIRLNADGSIDNTFNNGGTGANSHVRSVVLQPDGKILIGGEFSQYNGVNAPFGIIRLNADGSIDNTFNNGGIGTDNTVHSIAIQSDGKLLIGGDFMQYNGVDVPDRLIRLNADGSIDNTFNNGGTGVDVLVLSVALQADDKVLIGGFFDMYNGVDRPDGIMRLNNTLPVIPVAPPIPTMSQWGLLVFGLLLLNLGIFFIYRKEGNIDLGG